MLVYRGFRLNSSSFRVMLVGTEANSRHSVFGAVLVWRVRIVLSMKIILGSEGSRIESIFAW